MTKKTRIAHTFGFIIILIGLVIFLQYENKHLVISSYTYSSEKITPSLDGFKIIQLSDLHNAVFGHNNNNLIEKIKNQHPDIVVITGDLVDCNHTNIDAALNLTKEIVEICPVYYVTGNHEYWLEEDELHDLFTGLIENDVTFLNNESVSIGVENASFNLIGIDDRSLSDNTLQNIIQNQSDKLSIVLTHEPQYVQKYTSAKADFVFSGHAHGGQFRFPIIGGVFAPDQGFFPKYDSGLYNEGDTTMVVSRGLGNSGFPFRLFNYPEIVEVTLHYPN